jgi:hypothetical protein
MRAAVSAAVSAAAMGVRSHHSARQMLADRGRVENELVVTIWVGRILLLLEGEDLRRQVPCTAAEACAAVRTPWPASGRAEVVTSQS